MGGSNSKAYSIPDLLWGFLKVLPPFLKQLTHVSQIKVYYSIVQHRNQLVCKSPDAGVLNLGLKMQFHTWKVNTCLT